MGDLDPDDAATDRYRDRDRLAGIARPAVPHAVAENLPVY